MKNKLFEKLHFEHLFTLLVVIASTVLMFTAAACGGGNGSVNTLSNMSVTKSFEGARSIRYQIDAKTIDDYCNGGRPALTELLTANAPAGVTTRQYDEGDWYYFEISFSFANIEEYRNEINTLLAAGGLDAAEIVYSFDETMFRNGLVFIENVGNADLMRWAENAIVESGISDDVSSASFYSKDTYVSIDGTEYEEYGDIYIDVSEQHLLYSPYIKTSICTDHLEREIGLTAYSDTVEYFNSIETPLSEYFKKLAPSEVAFSVESDDWDSETYKFVISGNADQIRKATDVILDVSGNMFDYNMAPNENMPLLVEMNLKESVDFSVYTNDSASTYLYIFPDASYELSELGEISINGYPVYENEYYNYLANGDGNEYYISWVMEAESAALKADFKSAKNNTLEISTVVNRHYTPEWEEMYIAAITKANTAPGTSESEESDEAVVLDTLGELTVSDEGEFDAEAAEDGLGIGFSANKIVTVKFTGSEEEIERKVNLFMGNFTGDFVYETVSLSAPDLGEESDEAELEEVTEYNNRYFDLTYTKFDAMTFFLDMVKGDASIDFSPLTKKGFVVDKTSTKIMRNQFQPNDVVSCIDHIDFYSTKPSFLRLGLLLLGFALFAFGVAFALLTLKKTVAGFKEMGQANAAKKQAALVKKQQMIAQQQMAAQQQTQYQQQVPPQYIPPQQVPPQYIPPQQPVQQVPPQYIPPQQPVQQQVPPQYIPPQQPVQQQVPPQYVPPQQPVQPQQPVVTKAPVNPVEDEYEE